MRKIMVMLLQELGMRKKKNLTALGWLLAIVAAVALAFTACDPADNIIPKGVDEKGISYIEGGGSLVIQNIIIKSLEQLDEYTGLLPIEIFNSNYNNSFFENNNLIIIITGTGPGRSLKVEKIVLQDNGQLYIRINRIIHPGDYPAEVYPMCILIPVKKEYFNGGEIIVEYRNTFPKH